MRPYDYAIPGVLTNAVDWALRPPSPFRHKPVGVVGTSPGSVGTARGQMVLRQILLHPPAYVMPEPQMLIPFALQRFDEWTGDLVDERTRESMRRFLVALVEWTGRFDLPDPVRQVELPPGLDPRPRFYGERLVTIPIQSGRSHSPGAGW